MSSYSTTSRLSDRGSRPVSFAFPAFHSSLPYALVRDFAYPIVHPWHYGPPPESSEVPSGNSTPASERQRRLSDLPNGTWESSNPQWSAGPLGGDGFFSNQQLPQLAYGDGPPYSEDEDLHSPIVKSSRNKNHKSAFAVADPLDRADRARNGEESFHSDEDDEDEDIVSARNDSSQKSLAGPNQERGGKGNDKRARGSRGELVTYPPDQARQSMLAPNKDAASGHQNLHNASRLPNRSYLQIDEGDSDEQSLGVPDRDDSRYSRDYQFTIASPDEEMHGKAVALFDFARENENELPLTEGQIVWVSYRHGQGWLVAEDPKTRDAGLVPEEYVRLLRDIEGGWSSLSGELGVEEGDEAPPAEIAVTPTQLESKLNHIAQDSTPSDNNISAKEKRPPTVSTFSTSSKDLDPYPHSLISPQAKSTPPPVNHYGSQTTTPTVRSPLASAHITRAFEGLKPTEEEAMSEEAAKSNDNTIGR